MVGLRPSLTWKKPAPLIARSIGFCVAAMLPCVNCCDTDSSVTPMPTLFAPVPFIALAYMSANSARADFAPYVFALAMLLPITSRFLLVALRPESPCWKPIVRPCGDRDSVEGLDRCVRRAAALRELERQRVAAGADGVDPVAHQRGGRQRRRAAGGGDAEREVGVARLAGVPVEAVAAGRLR